LSTKAACFAIFAIKLFQMDPRFTIVAIIGIVVYHAMMKNFKEKNLNLLLLILLSQVRYVRVVNAVNY
jgi:hypothetical protein